MSARSRALVRMAHAVLPRWLSFKAVAAASGVGGAGLLAVVGLSSWATPPVAVEGGGRPAGRLATVSEGARGVSTSAISVDEAAGSRRGEECDCAPLWTCMQAGNGGCDLLDKQLRACLARQKLHAMRQGETVHSA